MDFLKKNYTSVIKKTKQWYNPNQNPNDFDKYAFKLLDKAQVDLFIEFMEINNNNIHVVDFNKTSLLMKAQGIPTYKNEHTKSLSEDELINRAIKAINYLVKKGIDINFKNKNDMTALLSASHWGYTKIVETLLVHGADPNISSHGPGLRTTPLLSAVFKSHKQVVTLLLIYGADPAETEKLSKDSHGFRLSDQDIKTIYSAHNIYKLVYLRKIQELKKEKTVLTNCSEMMFDEICRSV